MYASLMGRLAQADLFWPFFIQRMNSGTTGDSPHRNCMDRRILMASVLSSPLQLSVRWSSIAFADTWLNYVAAYLRLLTHVSSMRERTNRRAEQLTVDTRRERSFPASKTESRWLLLLIAGLLSICGLYLSASAVSRHLKSWPNHAK